MSKLFIIFLANLEGGANIRITYEYNAVQCKTIILVLKDRTELEQHAIVQIPPPRPNIFFHI